MSKRLKTIPKLRTEAAERPFWEKNDSTEFLAHSLAGIGRQWPAGATVGSLFDDLAGRTTPTRRVQMDRLFEVTGSVSQARPSWSAPSAFLLPLRHQRVVAGRP